MISRRLLIALACINCALLIYNILETRPVAAAEVPAVVQARSLEIVDDHGRVRASIKLHPADPDYRWPDGRKGVPETIMFRLIDANGRPEVKLGASEEGGGLGLIGQSDATQIVLKAEGAVTSVKLSNQDGKQQLLRP